MRERRFQRNRTTATLAMALAAMVALTPMKAQAEIIASQTRRTGTVAENRAHAEAVQVRVARSLVERMLRAYGVDEQQAKAAVAQLAPDELAVVAFDAESDATVRATGHDEALLVAFFYLFFWVLLLLGAGC